jgi:hypothetical protein
MSLHLTLWQSECLCHTPTSVVQSLDGKEEHCAHPTAWRLTQEQVSSTTNKMLSIITNKKFIWIRDYGVYVFDAKWLQNDQFNVLNLLQGHTQRREGCLAAASPNPPKLKLKKHRFCRYYDIKSYPSAEISHWNQLMTSTLEFWKIN